MEVEVTNMKMNWALTIAVAALFVPALALAHHKPVVAAVATEAVPHRSLLRDKPVIALWAAAATANALDMHSTEENLSLGAREGDPLMRPILRMPAPAVYVEQQAMIFGLAFLSHKMRESRLRMVRGLWWLPLAFQVQANLRGLLQNRRALAIHVRTSVQP